MCEAVPKLISPHVKLLNHRMEANKSIFKDPLNWSEGGVHGIMFFNSGSKIKIRSKVQLDYTMSLIKQAYDFVKSKD